MFFYLRTVEINNTDAEGRLVLADGVSIFMRLKVLIAKYCQNLTDFLFCGSLR